MKSMLHLIDCSGQSQIRYQFLSILCILLISVTAFPQGENWRIISEQPTPRHVTGSCVVDGKIYSIGGTSHGYIPGEQTVFSMVTRFDLETGVWDTCQSMPGPRSGLFACEINGKIFAFGGRRSNQTENLTVVEVYDIEKDEWSTGTSMPEGAAYASGCELDGKIYIIGGLQQSGWMATNQVLRYNPAMDSWEILEGLNTARGLLSASVVNGKIYAVGGATNPDIAYRIVEEYDPATNTWVEKTAIPTKRAFHAGVVINDRIWVMSGTEDFSTIKTTVDIYNPDKDTWSSAVKADHPSVGFWNPSIEAIDKKVYLFSGSAPPETRDVPEVLAWDFPVTRLLCDTLLTAEEVLKIRFYEEGNLYVVPEGTAADLDSITRYMVGSWQGANDQELNISLDTFSTGSYLAYGVASDGRIDRVVAPLHVMAPTYVDIPDTIFRNALLDQGVDINEDDRISHVEAKAILSMDVAGKGISDLTGIEAFINLVSLDCSGNELTSLNVSNCSALDYLDCSHGQLTNLDLLNNNALTHLNCSHNNLTALDLQNNDGIRYLDVSGNQLDSLDVSDLIWLRELYVGMGEEEKRNAIISLDLSNNPALEVLDCSGNQLTYLDLSNKNYLEQLDCSGNQLSHLDVSPCRILTELRCSDNQLASLNIAECWPLIVLDCSRNPLNTLNVSVNRYLKELSISEMPTLCKVCVWTTPFPPQDVEVNTTGSPHLFYTDYCFDIVAPTLWAADSLYQPTQIEVTSSENGFIYLVQEDTDKNLCSIREVCTDSVEAFATETAIFSDSLGDLTNNVYWLYARDRSFNLSEPMVFEIFGVGLDQFNTLTVCIYPNPTDGLVTIETDRVDSYVYKITNINGQMVHHGSFSGSSNQINLSTLQKGIYFVTLRSKDSNIIRKVVKR